MKTDLLHKLIGDTDIYLIDQILKGRYNDNDLILDAGCGTGRNMHWFLHSKMCIYGIDVSTNYITDLKLENASLPANRLQVARVELMPFGDNFFHHIISSAVLHFAESTGHFYKMFAEMYRVLKPGGTLFIRMTTDIGLEDRVVEIKDGVYSLPDQSTRFLLTRSILSNLFKKFSLLYIEPLKSVNVEDARCMSTLVLQKEIVKANKTGNAL